MLTTLHPPGYAVGELESTSMPILPAPPADYDDYQTTPPVAVRILAAHEWARLLNTHGSNGETDPLRAGMLHVLIGMSAAKNAPTDAGRLAFARALVTLGGGVVKTETNFGGAMHTHYHRLAELSVDYHPGLWLSDIAEAAGLPKVVWPMKTHSRLDTDCFHLRAGYGATSQHLYPLSDGRVLVSTGERLGVSPGWVAEAGAAVGFPPSVHVAGWNWRAYAEEIGVDAETGDGVKKEGK